MSYLVLLAVLPGFVLMHYVYKLDKIEPEPRKTLIGLLLGGALIAIPVSLTESFLEIPIFAIAKQGSFIGDLLEYFIGVALVEEYGKYFILKRHTWNSKDFNYRFDAIVYAAGASMGFAILENLFYVLESGDIQVAIIRAIFSVPGHFIFSVFMGIHYGTARFAANYSAAKIQKQELRKAVLIPVVLHGIYDFCLTRGEYWIIVFLVFIISAYVITFSELKKAAKEDRDITNNTYNW